MPSRGPEARRRRRPLRRHQAALAVLVVLPLAMAGCRAAARVASGPDPAALAQAAARERIAAEQAIDVAAIPERTVGVAPLAVDARDTTLAPLAYGLADLLMADLAVSRQLTVVDRLRLDALLRELALVDAGRVDTATAPRVGRLIGARRLVVGALAERPQERVHVDARIAEVATSDVHAAVSAAAPLAAILDAEKALALRLFDELGVTLTPAERRAVEALPTRSLAALLAYSRGVRYEVEGRYGDAARAYVRALRIDPRFARARARLRAIREAAPSLAGDVDMPATEQLWRVSGVTAEEINRSPADDGRTGRLGGGATDPSVTAGETARIVITVTTP